MCGIFGYTAFGKIEKPEALHRLITHLALSSQDRGTDATGFSSYSFNKEIVRDKMPYSAEHFIKLSYKFASLERNMPRTFIGHTRRVDNAHSPAINNNNHPFCGEVFDLIHNGVLYDWRNKAKTLGLDVRSGTDSEVYLRFLEKKLINRDQTGYDSSYNSLAAAFGDFGKDLSNGKYAIAAIDKRNGNLILARNVNPVHYFSTNFFGARVFVFASTFEILKNAISQMGAVFTMADAGTIEIIKPYALYTIVFTAELSADNRYTNILYREYARGYETTTSDTPATSYGSNYYSYYDINTEMFKSNQTVYATLDGFIKTELKELEDISWGITKLFGDFEIINEDDEWNNIFNKCSANTANEGQGCGY